MRTILDPPDTKSDGIERLRVSGTDLRPTRIGLGTWAIGGWMWGGSDAEDSIGTLLEAFDRGIALVDTAPAYGQGRSEDLVGEALHRHHRRDEIVVATKAGIEWNADGDVRRNASRGRILREVHDSLHRLRTSYIDIYQVHWPDPRVPVEETAEAMKEIYDQGLIRAIGVSNFSPMQMEAFRTVAPIHVCQPPYNLFERGIEEDVLPWCREHDVTVLAYGALCRGLLSGTMTAERAFEGDDLRREDPKFQPPRFERYLEAVDRLDRLARDEYQRRVIHLAVRWLLDRPGVGAALWGARRPEQIEPALGVFGWRLDAEAMERIDGLLRATIDDPVGPEFMAPPARGG